MRGKDLEFLARVPLFEGLSKADLRRILAETKEELYSSQQTIVREGSAGGRFYLILEGRGNVVINNRKVGKLGPGDYFGEMSLIDKQPRSATVVAETNIRALSLASWNFLALLEEHWALTRKVMSGLCSRIRTLDRSTTF